MSGADDLRRLAREDPAALRKRMAAVKGKVVIPHAGGQQEIMDCDKRFQIVCCGRRFGKTTIAAKKLLKHARQPNQMCWWVAPTYKVVKRGYAEVLRQLPPGLLTHTPPRETAFDAGRSVVLKLANGSSIEFYSSERPEGMLGAGVHYVVLDEAAIMAKAAWEQTVRPTLMDYQGKALLISTPRGRNWFYYLWLRGQGDDHPEYKSWRFATGDNPFIEPSEVEEMRESMPLIVFQQEVLAQFIASAGSVFRFNPEIIVDHVQPKGHVVVGVDLARSIDFTVFAAANADTGMPCGFHRMNDVSWSMQRNRLISFVKSLVNAGATHVTLLMDSTGVGDPFVEEIQAKGYDVVPINFTKTKQHMVMQLAKDLEDGCVRLGPEYIDEFENYTYKITENGRFTYAAPEGQHDDVVSATMLRHWGIVQEGAPNVVSIGVGDSEVVGAGLVGSVDEDDDWSDLLEEEIQVDSGVAAVVYLKPDSAYEIMSRPGAWGYD